jgi:hypothetical protein
MDQSSIDENRINPNNETFEISMNDIIMEQFEENASVQTKGSKNQKKETKEVMKINLKKLHVQRKFWKPHRRTFLCWGFYYVNNNVAIDFENAQIICCILCHKKSIIITNPKKKKEND